MLSLVLAALAWFATVSNIEDLAKRYPGEKISWSGEGLTWTCGPEDVWELKSFELAFRKDFSLACWSASSLRAARGASSRR